MKQYNYKEGHSKKALKFFQIAIAHAAVCALLLSCGDQDLSEKDFRPYEGPISIIENFELTYSDSAKIKVRLMAKKQLEYGNGDRFFPEGVYIEFYNKEEVLETTLQANKGKLDGKTKIYTATGDVKIHNLIQSKSLFSEELHWDPAKELIYTDKNVIIIQDGEKITGTGLEASQDFETYEIKNPRGSILINNPEDENPNK
ncbi:LPS export ABC transporter periplasmic protein LptC [Hyphobacterium sp. CCMP332]|nr:LPS export ABC transporter periplasmic protein LptC [Hyphobacterium sp. CCMP332]